MSPLHVNTDVGPVAKVVFLRIVRGLGLLIAASRIAFSELMLGSMGWMIEESEGVYDLGIRTPQWPNERRLKK